VRYSRTCTTGTNEEKLYYNLIITMATAYYSPEAQSTLASVEKSPARTGARRVVAAAAINLSPEPSPTGSHGPRNALADSPSSSDTENEDRDNKPVDPIAFAKAQAALQLEYKKRREKYLQTPLAARMETGINLKNLKPLSVRKAEFC